MKTVCKKFLILYQGGNKDHVLREKKDLFLRVEMKYFERMGHSELIEKWRAKAVQRYFIGGQETVKYLWGPFLFQHRARPIFKTHFLPNLRDC